MNDNNNEYTWRDESINEKRKSSIVEAVHTRSTTAARFIVIVFIFFYSPKKPIHTNMYFLTNICSVSGCCAKKVLLLNWNERKNMGILLQLWVVYRKMVAKNKIIIIVRSKNVKKVNCATKGWWYGSVGLGVGIK